LPAWGTHWTKALGLVSAADSLNNFTIVICGPTASGKSALALAVADFFNGEIINGDSMQIYRELKVLTARSRDEETKTVTHHLYGELSIKEKCSAGAWLNLAVDAITDVRARGKLPIVCGGTGLYLKILMEGIAEVPDVPESLTEDLHQLYEREGGVAFHKRLSIVDPESASKLTISDRQRLIRAYSVVEATGRKLGYWQTKQPAGSPVEGQFVKIVLTPPRDELYQRINHRLDAMVSDGAVEEVADVLEKNLNPQLPAMKALGVPEFSRYLRGQIGLNEAIENVKSATRHFAKRQFTWFRNHMTADLVIEDFGGTKAAFSRVKALLGTLSVGS
tara:strand:- start:324 stop:1325 length:1002 start_codon:yes stop_codon:yes gene_type:complete